MAAIIQFRRDTAANWTSNNPTLAVGEFGYESDNERYKIGDGSTAWTSLAYGGLGDIPEYLIDAKGDLIVGTADNTPGILTVGTNGQMLVADSAAAGGVSWATQESIVNWHEAVKVATAAVLPNTPSYSNGSSGVGATLTTATQVRLVVDGVNATTGDRVLVQDQATAAHNGIYDVTAQGASGSAVWLLTRADDFDGTPTGQIKAGDAVYALAGSTNAGQGFTVTSTSDPHTVGTHDVDFTQFTGTQAFTAGTGVSITGNTINVGTAAAARIVVNADDIDLATTGVSAAAYGSATQVPGYTVDAYGRLTAAANTTIAIPSTAVTDFTEAVQDLSGAQLATNGTHTGITATYDDAGDGAVDLALITENVQDITGAQLATNGSHTGITATYDDAGDGAVDLALITENVQDIVAGQLVTNGSHSGIAATYDDAGDGAIDLNVDDFSITLSGDIGGSGNVTNLGNVTIATTIQADSIALGTDTTGNYLATLAGTANEVEVSGSGSETAAVTVGLPSAVTITTSLTTPLVNVSGASIVIEGATANDFETTLTVTDPTADRTITFADATGTVVTTGNLSAATEHIEDTVGAQLVTNGSHTHLTAAYDDAGDGAIDIALDTTAVTAAAYGSATAVPGYTVDAYGRLTAASNTTIAIPSTAVTDFAEATQDVSGAQLATNGSHTGITATYDDAGDGAIDLALITENVQDITGAQLVTNGTHSGIAATYDDAGDGAIDLNVADFTITLGGDLTGNVTITDLASATLTATVAADSVALGTDSTGNYVATVAGTANEVNVSGSGSETAAVTIGLPDDVTIAGVLTVSGSIANGAVATTQSASDNSTKLATTAYVDTGLGALSSDSITDADANTKIQVEESADENIIRFDTAGTERMSIAADGTVTIVGNLVVNGTETTVSSTTITVDDKNIEIGSVASPSDTTADGGGLTLKGATDKTWNWVNSTDAWTSSEHIALATGKSVYIDGVLQLSKNALAATVVLADGVIATTQAANDSSTKVATTAFVMTEVGDYLTTSTAASTYAPLASPTLTGTPAAPTAAADTNTTQIATTAYVQTELAALSSDSITDADGDTKIQVEESSDEDIIRFDAGGTQRAYIDASGLASGDAAQDISPSSAGAGQLKILGNGYSGYTAMDGTGMYFGHNSGARTLVFQTDETDRMTIAGGGNVTIASVGNGLTLSRAGYDSYAFQHSAGSGMAIYNVTDSRSEMVFDGAGGVTFAGSVTISGDNDFTLATSNAQILGPASGSAAAGAVSYSFSGDTDTGLFRSDANQMVLATGGTNRVVIDGDGLDVTGNVIYNLERETQTGTTYTFVAGDRGKYVTMNNGSAQSVTVPPNSGVAFAVGTQIQVIGLGAGEITMVAGSGVTLRYTPGLKLRAQYSSVTCIKIATDEWVLVGDLEA